MLANKLSDSYFRTILENPENLKPTDRIVLVRVCLTEDCERMLNSSLFYSQTDFVKTMLKQKIGVVVAIGRGTEAHASDVKVGDKIVFMNINGDLIKDANSDKLYKFVEACEILATITE